MTEPLAADRFRVGDIWKSPRGKEWRVEKIHYLKGAFLRAMHNSRTTQWRNELATGSNMLDAWLRIHAGSGDQVSS